MNNNHRWQGRYQQRQRIVSRTFQNRDHTDKKMNNRNQSYNIYVKNDRDNRSPTRRDLGYRERSSSDVGGYNRNKNYFNVNGQSRKFVVQDKSDSYYSRFRDENEDYRRLNDYDNEQNSRYRSHSNERSRDYSYHRDDDENNNFEKEHEREFFSDIPRKVYTRTDDSEQSHSDHGHVDEANPKKAFYDFHGGGLTSDDDRNRRNRNGYGDRYYTSNFGRKSRDRRSGDSPDVEEHDVKVRQAENNNRSLSRSRPLEDLSSYNDRETSEIRRNSPCNDRDIIESRLDSLYNDRDTTENLRDSSYNDKDRTESRRDTLYNDVDKTENRRDSPYNDRGRSESRRDSLYNDTGKTQNRRDSPYNERGRTEIRRDTSKGRRNSPYNALDTSESRRNLPYNDIDISDNRRDSPYNDRDTTENRRDCHISDTERELSRDLAIRENLPYDDVNDEIRHRSFNEHARRRSLSEENLRNVKQNEIKDNDILLSDLGISIEDVKRYLSEEVTRRTDDAVFESSLRKLFQDKMLTKSNASPESHNVLPTTESLPALEYHHRSLSRETRPFDRSIGKEVGSNAPLSPNREIFHSNSPESVREISPVSFYSDQNRRNMNYSPPTNVARSISPFNSKVNDAYFDRLEDRKKKTEPRASKNRKDCTKHYKTLNQVSPKRKRKAHRRHETSTTKVDKRKASKKHTGESNTKKSPVSYKKHSYQKEEKTIRSDEKIGTRIEEFLIQAGENSVKQFKEQQASEFITNKLQMVQSLNFIPNSLPIHSPFSVQNTTFSLQPNTVFLSQSSISHVVRQQQIVLPNLTVATLPNNQKSETLPADLEKAVNDKTLPASSPNALYQQTAASEKDILAIADQAYIPLSLDEKPETTSTIDETLSLLRRSSNITNEEKEIEDDTARDDEEVLITRVVDPKPPKQRLKPVISESTVAQPTGRKVTLLKKEYKEKSPHPSIDQNKTKIRVPSWFTSRCIELFKKRHKKIQQLKRAKMDPNATARVGSIKETLRGIDREYIPLCKKRKSEYMQSGVPSEKSEAKSIGLNRSDDGSKDSDYSEKA